MKYKQLKLILVLLLITSLPAVLFSSPRGVIESTYNVKIYNDNQRDTWNMVSYELLSPAEEKHFLEVVSSAFSAYPADFFTGIGLKNLVICKNLKFDGTLRAAVPDNYKHQLFLSYNSTYSDYYIAHCFYHEVNHYAEYYIWNDYRYKWKEWTNLYTGTSKRGEYAYSNSRVDWYSITDSAPGFLNLYSTMGEEEDRSEIIAFYLNSLNSEHMNMMKRVKSDKVLNKKTILLLTLYKDKLGCGEFYDSFISAAGGK